MIAALRAPAHRIAFAIALSVLAHSALLWLPKVQLPHKETPLPPLAAKLEPLPRLAAKPALKPAAKPRYTAPPKPVAAPATPIIEPDSARPAVPEPATLPAVEAVSAVEAAPTIETIPNIEAVHAVEVASTIEPAPAVVVEEQKAAYLLPLHAQLNFAVYKGLDGFRIGEVKHQLEISGDKYILHAVTQTIGLARLFKSYQLTQTSRGKAGKQGLQPESFEEEKTMSDGKQSLKANFDWPSQKLRFSHGGETALPADAQDILSIFYQLSQLPLNREIIQIFVSNGKKLEKYNFEVGAEEEIITPMGKLRVLPLRKLHAQNEEGFEIWLGLEYRLLPVKIRPIERSGEVIGEIVITDIRIADN